ncbi:MAG: DUF4012 domain-containing protein, partial [Candidatus Nanopelagicales bacterium]|nr:DUF4012 domain-containing protein [Candidatus Nanopelagicales bacterium]
MSDPSPTTETQASAPGSGAGRGSRAIVGILAGLVVAVVGGFILWMQAGLTYSLVLLGSGGVGLQDHLSNAADGLTAGDYAAGEKEYELALESTAILERSTTAPQVNLIGRFDTFVTAVANWKAAVVASDEITQATGELLGLYGDLAGKNGSEKIFSDGAVDIDRLETVAPRVDSVLINLANAEASLNAIETEGRWTEGLDDVRNQALAEMAPVTAAVEVLVDIAPVLPQALGADGPRRYLVAVGNQAEMRASFGAPLTLLMVEFDDGRISIPVKGQTSTELFPPLNAPVQWF